MRGSEKQSLPRGSLHNCCLDNFPHIQVVAQAAHAWRARRFWRGVFLWKIDSMLMGC